MKFSITHTMSPEVISKLKFNEYRIDLRIADYLSDQLSAANYGTGLESFVIGLSTMKPKMLHPAKDFETGFIFGKRYVKSKRHLELEMKLNYHDLSTSTTENQVIDLISEALLKSYSAVEGLDIKNFDIGKFHNDLKSLLQDRSWLRESYSEKVFHYKQPQKNKNEFHQDEKMQLSAFWELVEKARRDSHDNFEEQIQIITDKLRQKEEKEIVGFECTLRELLIKANHYNVMAVQKIVEGSVNDDSFLYFRCKLILYGRITFENAINNPNYLFERIDPLVNGELLLSAADRAFSLKFGDDTDKVFPRAYASEVINYDSGDYMVQGKDWEDSDLPKRYSKLWKQYH